MHLIAILGAPAMGVLGHVPQDNFFDFRPSVAG